MQSKALTFSPASTTLVVKLILLSPFRATHVYWPKSDSRILDIRSSVLEFTTATLELSFTGFSPLNQMISGGGFPTAYNTSNKHKQNEPWRRVFQTTYSARQNGRVVEAHVYHRIGVMVEPGLSLNFHKIPSPILEKKTN